MPENSSGHLTCRRLGPLRPCRSTTNPTAAREGCILSPWVPCISQGRPPPIPRHRLHGRQLGRCPCSAHLGKPRRDAGLRQVRAHAACMKGIRLAALVMSENAKAVGATDRGGAERLTDGKTTLTGDAQPTTMTAACSAKAVSSSSARVAAQAQLTGNRAPGRPAERIPVPVRLPAGCQKKGGLRPPNHTTKEPFQALAALVSPLTKKLARNTSRPIRKITPVPSRSQ